MKKALLVGINNYTDSPLRGCVNDCLLMYKVLTEAYAFNPVDVKVLTDNECTKDGILQGLKWLTTGVTSRDTVFFHYSGHGSQIMVDDWTNSNEMDGRDEVICPVNADWYNIIRDHDLGAFFKKLPVGAKSIVVLDCCHSGTGLRNSHIPGTPQTDDDFINRFMPPPPSNILSNPKVKLDDLLNFTIDNNKNDIQTQKRGVMNSVMDQGDTILISGCQDNQTSADAWIGGRYHGALTYTLLSTLAENSFKMNYRKLVQSVNQKLDRMRFTQNPQLECRKDFFGVNFLG